MQGEHFAERMKQIKEEAEEALKENPSPSIRERLEAILEVVDQELSQMKH